MNGRILSIAEVGEILRLGYPDLRDMVARREIPALAVVAGDALISEGALWELIDGAWAYKPEGGEGR